MKFLIFPITNNVWFHFRKMHFHHCYYYFVKFRQRCFYHICIFETKRLFVNIKSMYVGFSGFLKHVGSFVRFRKFHKMFSQENPLCMGKSHLAKLHCIQMIINLYSWKDSPDVILYYYVQDCKSNSTAIFSIRNLTLCKNCEQACHLKKQLLQECHF